MKIDAFSPRLHPLTACARIHQSIGKKAFEPLPPPRHRFPPPRVVHVMYILYICQIEGIWSAKDMESLDRPERRELIKTDREALSSVSRLEAAGPYARAIAEVFAYAYVENRRFTWICSSFFHERLDRDCARAISRRYA